MSEKVQMRCRVCGVTSDPAPVHYCAECFGPLEVVVEPPEPGSVTLNGSRPLIRYQAWLPVVPTNSFPQSSPGVVMAETLTLLQTSLLRAENLGAAWGLRRLYLKDETSHIAGSFKDRLVAVALERARSFGFDTVICASTGNLARSVLYWAHAFHIKAQVLVPEAHLDSVPHGVIAVRGTYDEANRLAIEVAQERGWGVVNVTLHPFYAEGGKTIGHEIVEQLGGTPQHLVCCMAGGSLIGKVHQGMEEMAAYRQLPTGPIALHGAQAAGCAPIVAAFERGSEDIVPIRTPTTRVHSLAVGDPGDGFFALRRIRATGGTATAIPDDEAEQAARQCQELEGIETELAGGVTLAAARRLVKRGILGEEEAVVLVLTGRAHTTTVTGLPRAVIDPTREAFRGLSL
jgi:threonine synthase